MGFSKIKLKPSDELCSVVSPIVFNNVRSSEKRKSIRTRQCYKCMENIKTNEEYINHQFRYDKTIMTINFHLDCFGH